MAGYIGTKASVVTPGAERKKVFSITGTTTSLTGLVYTPGFVHVFHNGIRLVDGTDYTATNGTSITLTTAAENGDEVVVISLGTFQVADAYTKAEADSRYVNVTGDTMTGTLTATTVQVATLSNAAGTGPATLTGQFTAKMWINFNGTGTAAIRDSGNVSSLTDNGTGNYTSNFTSAMSDGNYAGLTTSGNGSGSGWGSWTVPASVASSTASSHSIVVYTTAGAFQDQDQIMAGLLGDLA